MGFPFASINTSSLAITTLSLPPQSNARSFLFSAGDLLDREPLLSPVIFRALFTPAVLPSVRPLGVMSTGEWLPSIVTVDNIRLYQDEGLIPRHGCRLTGPGEVEPHPREDERVLLLSHVDRGFSLPPHPFLLDFLAFTGSQLHHIVPNSITLLASLFSLCEGFLGIDPHWNLFRTIYTIKPQKIKKSGEAEINHLCGGDVFVEETRLSVFYFQYTRFCEELAE